MGGVVKSITSNPLNATLNVATGGFLGYDKGISGGAIPGLFDSATGSNVSGAISKVGKKLGDIALGEKTPEVPDKVIDLSSPQGRAFQEQALGLYGQELGKDYGQIAGAQTASQEQQIRQNALDQQRRAQQMVAQRGLGGTSIGLNALLGQGAGMNEQIGALRAQAPGLEQQMRQQGLNFATGGINQIMGEQGTSRVLQQGSPSVRQGGLAPLIGAGIGGYLGGPAGAQVGMGIGKYATQMG